VSRVLQCVAVCCSVLQCVAVCEMRNECFRESRAAVCCKVFQRVPVFGGVLQHVKCQKRAAVSHGLQCVAVC